MLFEILATVTLHWTNPGLARYVPACGDSTVRAPLTRMDAYYSLVGSTGAWSFLRSHTYSGTVPLIDSLNVPDSPAATYWVIPWMDTLTSQCEPRGYTVGVPNVGVPPLQTATRPQLYDIAGRRVLSPIAGGIYFTKARRIVFVK